MKIWHAPFVIARHYAHHIYHIHASINVLHRALPSRNGMAFCFARQFDFFPLSVMSSWLTTMMVLNVVRRWRHDGKRPDTMLFAQFVIAHVLWCDLVRMMLRAKKTKHENWQVTPMRLTMSFRCFAKMSVQFVLLFLWILAIISMIYRQISHLVLPWWALRH